jgi:protein-S-isoprenylcysteine O-methyltransferase Ste14
MLFLLCVLAMLALHWWLPLEQWPTGNWTAPGLLLIVGGPGITLWHARLFQRRQTNIKTFDTPDRLVTEGLFRISRNPMYLGFNLTLLGAALLLGSASPFAVVLVFLLISDRWYIAHEERIMANTFGKDYQDYCKRVRRWL